MPHSKTLKSAKKLSGFGENRFRRLSNFLQTHIFWNFDHISRNYSQIDHRNILFSKITIILIMMAKMLFFDIFFEKDPDLNTVEINVVSLQFLDCTHILLIKLSWTLKRCIFFRFLNHVKILLNVIFIYVCVYIYIYIYIYK